MTKQFESGGRVRHKRYGAGVVQREWGSWFVCRNCFTEMEREGKCPYCGRMQKDLKNISGAGVYDVRFGNRTRSISHDWLRPIG